MFEGLSRGVSSACVKLVTITFGGFVMVMDRKEYYWSFGGGLLVLVLFVGVAIWFCWWRTEAAVNRSADAPATNDFVVHLHKSESRVEETKKASAPAAVSQGATPPNVTTPSTVPAPAVSNATLIRDLNSTDESTVNEAVLQLSDRPDAAMTVLEKFATGDIETKRRAWAWLKDARDITRPMLKKIVRNPWEYEARIVAAAREILIKGFRENLETKVRPKPSYPLKPADKIKDQIGPLVEPAPQVLIINITVVMPPALAKKSALVSVWRWKKTLTGGNGYEKVATTTNLIRPTDRPTDIPIE